ncbi:MAG: hypothetical protein FJ029_07930, partial [Actinobacteria bacterium]|nr:hypothetical protein [Actinomycetota bacterium]
MTNDSVEIFAFGTELVSGLILDTNSHWLSSEISLAGGQVRRITALEDDLEAMVRALNASIDRQTRIILSTGGLGPTPDDLTVDALAQVGGCDVHTPRVVLEDYARRRNMSFEEVSTPPRIKMGSVPSASRVHLNPVGWAPCFSMDVRGTTLWAMPGPPKEVEGCFGTHIRPVVESLFAGRSARLRVYINAHESETSPYLQKVMRELPHAYLKAYVGLSTPGGLPLDIVIRSSDGQDPQALLQEAYG